jgi:hypothetical protein
MGTEDIQQPGRVVVPAAGPAAAARLLEIEEEPALEQALAQVDPVTAARAVAAAPTLQRKTTLLWAMDDAQRRQVLEFVPAPVIGALVQNLEEDNRYLLGDLSLEQFHRVLGLCSPERKFYWLNLALSFTDARANALPLLLTTREFVEILLTRSEFEEHLQAVLAFPLEDQRLPEDLLRNPTQTLIDLIGPNQWLRQFPIKEERLARIVQTVLDYDPDRFADIIRQALAQSDYREAHPSEWQALTEEPVLLAPEDLAAPAAVPVAAGGEAPVESVEPPLALVPVGAPPLLQRVQSLSQQHQWRVAEELQQLFIRQAVAEGGSFLQSDLLRVARSVEAYLLLGLQVESGGRPEREAGVLQTRPVHKISRSGARVVERLRQAALRMEKQTHLLDPDQRTLVRSIVRPRLTVDASGRPLLILLPGDRLPERADLAEAADLLRQVGAWVELARALGGGDAVDGLERRGTAPAVAEELARRAVLHGRLELPAGEAAAGDLPAELVEAGAPSPEAWRRLREAVSEFALEHRLPAEEVFDQLAPALERIAQGSTHPSG